jgi:hypothetical protein
MLLLNYLYERLINVPAFDLSGIPSGVRFPKDYDDSIGVARFGIYVNFLGRFFHDYSRRRLSQVCIPYGGDGLALSGLRQGEAGDEKCGKGDAEKDSRHG